jgi:hypothetical protein
VITSSKWQCVSTYDSTRIPSDCINDDDDDDDDAAGVNEEYIAEFDETAALGPDSVGGGTASTAAAVAIAATAVADVAGFLAFSIFGSFCDDY